MDLVIRDVMCGNKNCIGVSNLSVKPEIIIEDKWTLPQRVIENAIEGLVSHEKIEWILLSWGIDYSSDLHNILNKCTFKDYYKHKDGLPLEVI